jgi:DNA-binding MarR family transcriptional regulator
MMTSQVIRKLVEKRLIIRYRNSEDSREFILEATEKGLNIAKRAIKTVETVEVNFFNSLNEQDRKRLVSILLRLSLNGISLDSK